MAKKKAAVKKMAPKVEKVAKPKVGKKAKVIAEGRLYQASHNASILWAWDGEWLVINMEGRSPFVRMLIDFPGAEALEVVGDAGPYRVVPNAAGEFRFGIQDPWNVFPTTYAPVMAEGVPAPEPTVSLG